LVPKDPCCPATQIPEAEKEAQAQKKRNGKKNPLMGIEQQKTPVCNDGGALDYRLDVLINFKRWWRGF
jgi:hypothetical protein